MYSRRKPEFIKTILRLGWFIMSLIIRMLAIKAFLTALLLASAGFAQELECFCRIPEGGETPFTGCWNSCSNGWAPLNIMGQNNVAFNENTTICPMFIKSSWILYSELCPDENYYFPEAHEQCLALQDIYYNDQGELYAAPFWHSSSTNNGRYFIPYCYGLNKIYLYETIGIGADKSFRLVNVLSLERKIESLKIFGDYLVLVDFEAINVYKFNGRALRMIGEVPFQHNPLDLACSAWPAGAKYYLTQDEYVLKGSYLYLLPTYYMSEYGTLLTYKLGNNSLELVQADRDLPGNYGEDSENMDLFIEEAEGVPYLVFFETANCSEQLSDGHTQVFRIRDGLPEYMYQFKNCRMPPVGFKNGKIYYDFGQDPGPPWCKHVKEYKFNNGEIIETGREIAEGVGYFGDNFAASFYMMQALCTTEDDYPGVAFEDYPSSEVSGRFILSGTASDSEGIRSVFIGAPWFPYLHRAEVFKITDTTSYWMAVLDTKYFAQEGWVACPAEQRELVAVVEDMDGDSNMNFDAWWQNQLGCIRVSPEADEVPFGHMDIHTEKKNSLLEFAGWALDNSGILRGWLISEDAQVLAPLNFGCERPDVEAKYPGYPDALHSGFDIAYDILSIPEGEYEFTVRLMAYDHQALDFGPYVVTIDRSHSRPVTRP
jgi:hypothetical protein